MKHSKKILVILGTVAVLALASCGSSTTATDGGNDTRSAAGGAGGNGTAGGGGVGSGGSGGSTGNSDAATACDPAYKCATIVSTGTGDPSKLCPGTVAAMKFDTLNTCACMLACASKCGDNLCAKQTPSTACLTCLMDTTTAGCGNESAACAAN